VRAEEARRPGAARSTARCGGTEGRRGGAAAPPLVWGRRRRRPRAAAGARAAGVRVGGPCFAFLPLGGVGARAQGVRMPRMGPPPRGGQGPLSDRRRNGWPRGGAYGGEAGVGNARGEARAGIQAGARRGHALPPRGGFKPPALRGPSRRGRGHIRVRRGAMAAAGKTGPRGPGGTACRPRVARAAAAKSGIGQGPGLIVWPPRRLQAGRRRSHLRPSKGGGAKRRHKMAPRGKVQSMLVMRRGAMGEAAGRDDAPAPRCARRRRGPGASARGRRAGGRACGAANSWSGDGWARLKGARALLYRGRPALPRPRAEVGRGARKPAAR
jgi:hypothetical protein